MACLHNGDGGEDHQVSGVHTDKCWLSSLKLHEVLRTPHHENSTLHAKQEVLIVKFESKRSLGRPWYRWEDNNEYGLKKTEWEGVDWIR